MHDGLVTSVWPDLYLDAVQAGPRWQMGVDLMLPVRTAVIPAAGLGTRLLPITKAIPKELVPLIARPCIEYVMEEAIEAGISEFVIVTGRNDNLIRDYFTTTMGHLDVKRELAGRLESLDRILRNASVRYVQQDEPKGLGHAVLCAAESVRDERFAVILPDDIVVQETPCLSVLVDVATRLNGGALAIIEVPQEQVSSYGIVRTEATAVPGTHRLRGLIEKPGLEDAPSRFAVVGRYILPACIFDMLRITPPGTGGEIQLTDAISALLVQHRMYACEITGERYDVGNKLGLAKASMRFALDDTEIGRTFREYATALLAE